MRKLFTFFIFCLSIVVFPIKVHALQNLKAEDSPLFSETFDTEEDFQKWVCVDKNGGVTWRYFEQMAAYLLDPELQGDDWLISPSIQLEPGKVYKLIFKATIPTTSSSPESFSVTLGTSTDPDSHTTVLADYPEYRNSDETPIEITLSVPTTGTYHIGYHVYSQPEMFRLMLDDVMIYDTGRSTQVPGSVTSSTITPDSEGNLSATLTFNAPAKSYAGAELNKIEAINIYRNGSESPVHVINNPSVGEALSWTDNDAVLGSNTYKIIATNEYGEGPSQTISAYVGTDIPVAISDAKIKIVENSVEIAWAAPSTGINNGYINTQALTYRIVRNDDSEVATDISGTSFKDNTLDLTSEQHSVYYTIYPSSTAGEGVGTQTNKQTIGEPLTIPFKESFEYAEYENDNWTTEILDNGGENFTPWLTDVECIKPTAAPQDSDDGLIYFNSYWFSGTARLITPLVDISSTVNPKLTFWLHHYTPVGDDYEEYNDRIRLEVSTNSGEFIEVGEEIPVMKKGSNGWTKYEYPLISYKDSKYIQISFKGISDYGYNIALDNIKIEGAAEKDLSVGVLSGKKRINTTEEETYTVTVKNEGAYTTSDYSVEFYVNDKLLNTAQGITLAPQGGEEFAFKYTASLDDITENNDSHHLVAKIVFAEDETADNNEAELNITVRKPNLPLISELSGKWEASDEQVKLHWTAPIERKAATSETVTEGFESYEAFSISDFGDWTLIDRDGSETYNFDGVVPKYTNKGKPMAFQIFNPSDIGLGEDWYFIPNSEGKQYAICPSASNGPNNDWLVSPLLSTEEQTVSFYAKSIVEHYGLERFVFWYSTTDTHPDSFIKLSDGDHVKTPTFWKEYQYTVPAGARYFAIQCVSDDAILMFIDDITFVKSNGDPETVNLRGYNIYRDGVRLNESLVSTPEYSDAIDTDGDYIYKVTAVYDKGESAYSETINVNVNKTSISTEEYSALRIYSENKSLIIDNIENKAVSIYSVDGKLVYSNNSGDNSLKISLNLGIYIVKVGSLTTKVVVK